jgi:cysteine desulfurase
MSKIYFDHSATTPTDPEVLSAILPYFSEKFANASSVHGYGQEAALAVDQARATTAQFFNVSPSEVLFCSGATEANNLALFGLVKALSGNGINKPHIITSILEHDAILEPCKQLELQGLAELTYLPVNDKGLVELEALQSAIQDNTVLVSIVYVSSELGTLQPIKQIGRLIEKVNEQRFKAWQALPTGKRLKPATKLYFHTDATQAINFFTTDFAELKLDMLSLSAHKIYGPKGVGALIARQSVPLLPLIYGGHHERNLRSGTINVPGVLGLAKALEIVQRDQEQNNQHLTELRNYFVSRVQKEIPNSILNTDLDNSSPAHAHLSFTGASGESILMALAMEAGIAVSTGSACANNTSKVSSAILALGLSDSTARSSLRFTFGKNNTRSEVDLLLKVLPDIVAKFRA